MPHRAPTPVFRSAFDLPAGRKVLIYGAGAAGQVLAAYLRAAGRPAAGFVDTYRTGSHAGLPIHPPAVLSGPHPPDGGLCVLIASFDRIAIAGMLDGIAGLSLFDAYALAGDLVHEERRMASLIDPGGIDVTA